LDVWVLVVVSQNYGVEVFFELVDGLEQVVGDGWGFGRISGK
jgi:hypothetical protein